MHTLAEFLSSVSTSQMLAETSAVSISNASQMLADASQAPVASISMLADASRDASQMLAERQRRAAVSRAASQTPERRAEIARAAAQARWAKRSKRQPLGFAPLQHD
jgi:hypothetical protein